MIEPLFAVDGSGEIEGLSAEELAELTELVDRIKLHEKDYFVVGGALCYIQQRRLYRAFGSFEDFIHRALDMERSHCFRFMQAYEVVLDLSPMGDSIPENERQCRELTGLKTPEDRQKAWAAVLSFAGDQPTTAEMVRNIVRPMLKYRRPTHKPAAPLPVGTDYGIILADPPWQYEANSTTKNREIEEHYPTMTLEDIKGLPVAGLAGNHCVLFLWTTAPKIMEAGEVIAAWGFNYRTKLVWDKGGMGLGHYVRQNAEDLLIAVRGNPGTPDTANRPASPVHACKLRHSEKPEVFHDIIEMMYPGQRRIELFARRPRDGWDVWGNEVE